MQTNELIIYNVVEEDREELITVVESFKSKVAAWSYLLEKAKTEYSFNPNVSTNYKLVEGYFLNLYDKNVYYEIHTNKLNHD